MGSGDLALARLGCSVLGASPPTTSCEQVSVPPRYVLPFPKQLMTKCFGLAKLE